MTESETRGAPPTDIENAVAVVGMAAHLPGARDVSQFWDNLRGGVESIRRYTDEELLENGVPASLLDNPHYVKANGTLDEMEWFDAGFFGMSPRDAAIMDPQTRHFLECVWHALEHSGHVPERFPGSIGVFAGAGAAQYFWKNIVQNPELMESVGYFLLRHTGNDKDFLSTRASYEFSLKGPSIGLQTACSTSLVAIHYAAQSLLSWECDMALAGGVTIEQPHHVGYLYQEGEILSSDGHCRSFDHKANGTVFGSGAGVVVLRRLDDAIEDGDTIHAIIRGSAVNNDGAGKVSYLAPSVDGQAAAIAEALSVADISPATLGMVEAHGTATPVGDPIEVAALTQAFRAQTDDRGYCALGSVKSNLGHLDTAAGVASFIKAVLAVQHGEIPATVHFEKPNPLLELDSSPFYVPSAVTEWPAELTPRRAGVSSLGVGGTNAHVVVEEAPALSPTSPSRRWQLLTLSGRSATVVEDASRDLIDFLDTHPAVPLADVSYTLRNGRRRFKHRRALVCMSGEEAIEILATGQAPSLTNATTEAERRDVTFLFAGGGAQYPNMGRELYDAEEVYREAIDRCLTHFAKLGDFDLRALLFPPAGQEGRAAAELRRPSRALPALFATQYAQAHLWMAWGISPASMIGHSMGEYTAACIAGVFEPEAGMSLVYKRGQLFESLERGGMLSVSLGEKDLLARLGSDLSIAALNAPEASVAAGPVDAIEALEAALTADGIDCQRVRIDVAAHSSMLDAILPEFERYLRTMDFAAPTLPVISNLTGEIAGTEMTEPEYWVRHLRETVRFSDGLERVMAPDGPVLLEVGPGRTLATLARMHPGWTQEQPSLNSLPHPGEPADAQAFQLAALGALWAHGVDPEWEEFDAGQRRRRVPLPGYPFERERHFVEPPAATAPVSVTPEVPEADRRDDPSEWFHRATWKAVAPLADVEPPEGSRVMVIADRGTPGAALAERVRASGCEVTRVMRGEAFSIQSDADYSLRPGEVADWKSLIGALHATDTLPDVIVHTWGMKPVDEGTDFGDLEEEGFFAPLFLLQALEAIAPGREIRFVVATTGVAAVNASDVIEPSRALLLGPVRVAPKEVPSLKARLVDVGVLPEDAEARGRLDRLIMNEVFTSSDESVVAYRDFARMAEAFEPAPLRAPAVATTEPGGVYVITGGLGGIGLVLAREVASRADVKLVLLSRSELPSASARAEWLAEHPDDNKVSRALREIARLEQAGAEVVVHQVDVTDAPAMAAVMADTAQRFGTIRAVIHAAGVLDDGPMLSRSEEESRAVLAPKVTGSNALFSAIDGLAVETVVLFSSVSAVIGAPGQVDYTAANAYLDALALKHRGAKGPRVVSLGWGAWKDVGMAAELAGETRYGPDDPALDDARLERIDHDVFQVVLASDDGSRAYRGRLEHGTHWMLDEHRVRDGSWVLPGSGYVELIRGAFRLLAPRESFLMSNLVFLQPFGVTEERGREIEVRLSPGRKGKGWDVSVRGRTSEQEPWSEHAEASVGQSLPRPDVPEPLASAVARVGSPAPEPQLPDTFMDFGPRWSNIVARASADGEALLAQQLADDFADDLAVNLLHPALLDMATAGAQSLVPGLDRTKDFMVPAGYGELNLHGAMAARMTSHVRLRNSDESAGIASFDVTVYGPTGDVVVDIRDFSMIRVSGEVMAGAGQETDSPGWLRDAISPSEGQEVFRRVMADSKTSHWLVATRPLEVLVEEASRAPVRARAAGTKHVPQRGPIIEVAAALEAHEMVAEATAVGCTEAGQPARVVAFVVYESGAHATVSELRRFTRKAVGPELTPQNFVEMVSLPRDEHGVLQFAELRDPFAAVDDYVAPRTATEGAIARIWSELLGLDRVGVYDNFLDVGGHSLVGIRVLLRIQQETGVRLEANALTLQTLEQLAADVEREGGVVVAETEVAEPSVAPEPDDDSEPPEGGRRPARPTGFLSRVRRAVTER